MPASTGASDPFILLRLDRLRARGENPLDVRVIEHTPRMTIIFLSAAYLFFQKTGTEENRSRGKLHKPNPKPQSKIQSHPPPS